MRARWDQAVIALAALAAACGTSNEQDRNASERSASAGAASAEAPEARAQTPTPNKPGTSESAGAPAAPATAAAPAEGTAPPDDDGKASGAEPTATPPATTADVAAGKRRTWKHLLVMPTSNVRVEPAAAGGDCAAVASHLVHFPMGDLEALGRAFQRGPGGEQQRKQRERFHTWYTKSVGRLLETTCAAEQWSAQLRDCALRATDRKSLVACEPLLPPPTYGKVSCDDVADHLAKLMVPPGRGARGGAGLGPVREQLRSDCEQNSDDMRRCQLAMTSMDDLVRCALID